jgi:alpha-beta hydrolase superfamily lysophospholipase
VSRFKQFPTFLAQQSRTYKFGEIPVLLAHPNWERPAPVVLWMHGRTANKELDPGRYQRWIRAGIAACAIDLPGHGERAVSELQTGRHSPAVIAQAVREIDVAVQALGDAQFNGVFDLARLAIGGMSLGGMIALRRLCDPHTFKAACVEATTGWLTAQFFGGPGVPADASSHARHQAPPREVPENLPVHDREKVREIDPMEHLRAWRPIPLLALHSDADRLIPVASMQAFIDRLREHYQSLGADPSLVRLQTWPNTGAPDEHIGFGRVSSDAKNMQTAFLKDAFGLPEELSQRR